MSGSLIPRPFSPTDAKRDRDEKARLAERGDGSLWVASARSASQIAAERAEREAALAQNQTQLDSLNDQLDTELPALQAELTENAAQVAQAQTDIAAANGQIGIVQTAVAAADAKAAIAQTAAATADTKAGTAQTAADSAAQAAASAAGIAAGKGKVLTQSAAPGAEDRNANTLWIDTTGGANTPKRWTTGTTWVAVTDKAAADAAAAAAAAQAKANTAFADAQTALTNAGLAQTAADGKASVYYTNTAPSGTGFKSGDIWFRGTDNRVHIWDTTLATPAWVAKADNAIATAQSAANAASTAAATADSKAVTAQNKANQATTDAATAQTAANNAATAAATADGKAVTAQNKANQATLDAAAAKTAGDNAAASAATADAKAVAAQTKADKAETDAAGALTAANTAASAASTADGKAVAAQTAAINAANVAAAALPKIIAGANQKTFLEAASISVNGGAASIGDLVIQTGIPTTANYMCRIDVGGFLWTTATSELDMSVAFYANTGVISNAGYTSIGSLSVSQVKILKNTTTNTLVLVLTADGGRFDYIKASVTRALVGYALPPDSVGTGWSMAIGADVSAHTLLRTLTVSRDLNDTHTLTQGWRTTGQTTIDGGKITADSVTAGQIAANAITATELAADAVTAAKIKAGEITAAKLVTGTLTSASGVFGAVDASILNAGTLNAARLLAGDVRAKFIEAGKITAADIVTASLTSASGIFGTMDASVLNAGTINSARLVAADIRTLFLTAGKIVAADLVAGTLTSASGVFGTMDASVINAGTLNAARLAAGDVRAKFLEAGKIVAADLVAGTLTSASGVFGTVDASVLNAGTLNAARLNAGDVRAKFLAAGLVTAADMVAGTITAASGIIGSLDAGVITAGTLNAARLAAGSIAADKLLIGSGENGIVDPGFTVAELNAARQSRSSGTWVLGSPAVAGFRSFAHLTTTTNDAFHFAPVAPATGSAARGISVQPGQKWLLTVDVETDISAGVRWNQYRYNADGTVSYVSMSPYNTGVGKRELSYVYTVPAGQIAMDLALACNVSGVNWTVYGDALAARQSNATLIEDGAITTTKVATDAILANHIKAGEVVAGKLAADSVVAANIKADAVTATKILAGSIGTGHMVANSINADRLVANSITAAKINAGAVTADKLESELVLATKIVAGDPAGTHAEMAPSGFRVFAAPAIAGGAATEVVRLGVASTDDYFAVTKADGGLAATISQDGKISASQLNANDALYYKGDELRTLLDRLPQGIVDGVFRTTDATNPATAGGAGVPYLRLETKLKINRVYRISTSSLRAKMGANSKVTIGLSYRFDAIADMTNKTTLANANVFVDTESAVLSDLFSYTTGAAERTVSFLLWWAGAPGSTNTWMAAAPDARASIVVEDMGSMGSLSGAGVWLDGTGTPPPAKNTYEKDYPAWTSMNYQGNNTQYNYDTGRMYQGLSPAGYGNTKSIALIPDMTADLSGATINWIRVYFYFDSWYYNAGGTARIGLHAFQAIPATYSIAGVVATSSGWPRPGARWVDIPSQHWDNFKSGAYRGIALEGDGTLNTYGIAQRPVVRINYTK